MSQKHNDLYSAIAYSYIHLLDDYLAVLSNPSYTTLSYMDHQVDEVAKNIKTFFLDLPQILDTSLEKKETYAQQTVAFRKLLEDKYRTLHALQRQLHHLTSLFNLKKGVATTTYEDFGMTEEEAAEMDYSMLAKDCTSFVFQTADKATRQMRSSSLLASIPMRMTKESFIAYVKKSLSKVQIEDTPSSAHLFLSVLDQQFDGRNYPGYFKHYDDLREGLEELESLEDGDTFFEQAELINETLDEHMALITHLYHLLCVFGNLLLLDDFNFDDLTALHMSFYDLYHATKVILEEGEDASIFLETLPERVLTLKEELEAIYQKTASTSLSDPLLSLLDSYIHLSIGHVFGFITASHPVYSEDVTQIFETFIQQLKSTLDTLPPTERKLRMQYFMSVIPFIMNDTTFYNYVLQGFKGSQTPKRNLFTAMYLSNVLEQGGFFDEQDEHKEHDEHCGCNHSH